MPAVDVTRKSNSTCELEGRITAYVVISGIMAATGGLMFGYDIGISGGVTAMDDFLVKFFPWVHRRKHEVHEDNYCKFNDHGLQLFTSSLYLGAFLASFAASKISRNCGRKASMQVASIFFLLGVVLDTTAIDLPMLILGRILLGIGVGFGNHAIPLFLSEIAPARIRGALNILFQLDVTIGILIANIVNYYATDIHPWGWRLSLGLASVPALFLCFGSFLITDTPTSLIEREKVEEGIAVLKKIRGTQNVRAEYEEILRACGMAWRVQYPFRELRKRASRPPLVVSVALQFFQQFTGINAIMFYAPLLLETIGFMNDTSLLSAVVTCVVNVFSTFVSLALVDKLGRRALLLQSCLQMFITQTAIGGVMLVNMKADNRLEPRVAFWMVMLVCLYVMSFAWSWGPLGWLIPSEVFPLQTRTVGISCAVSSNMLFTFVIAQAFLSMLCRMKAGIFSFFAGWILIMTLFVLLFLPETKGVDIDEVDERVWKQHWYWKRYMEEDDGSDI